MALPLLFQIETQDMHTYTSYDAHIHKIKNSQIAIINTADNKASELAHNNDSN